MPRGRTAPKQRGGLRVPARGVARPVVRPQAPPPRRSPELLELRRLYKVAAKADMLRRAVEARRPRQRHFWASWRGLRSALPQALAAIVVLAAGYVVVDVWLTNRRIEQQAAGNQAIVAAATTTDATPEQRQEAEGRDERPQPHALDNYRVEASLPRAIFIDKLNVKARTLPMSVNPDGSMQAPINIDDAGWYTGSVKPGQKGAAIIVAHASGPTRRGLFAYLDTLKAGDQLAVERGDGSRLNYQVLSKKVLPLDKVDMEEMFRVQEGDEGLNLMTCAGKWLAERKTFEQRVMVFTKRLP